MADLLNEVMPFLMELLALILTAVLVLASRQITAWTGVQIEAKHRDALHEAIMSGVESAMHHGFEVGAGTFKAHVLAHIRESVPDAMEALNPLPDVLERIIERKAREALSRIGEPK